MIDIIKDTLFDSLKILPFLFVVFLFMELLEHKISNKSKEKIENTGKLGPIIGSLLGAVPQCGFSVAATNLYIARVISLGTLISIYLATSDEMLPIMISEKVEFSFIIKVILIKVIIGLVAGLIIDLVIRKKEEHIHDICEECNCDCEHNLLKSVIKHTLSIFFFIVVIEFMLNAIMYYYGEEALGNLLLKNNMFSPFLTSLIGLIPNCAASVIITELFIKEAITFGAMLSGLLTGSGIAVLILFKENKNLKENLFILVLIYLIGALSGIVLNLFI